MISCLSLGALLLSGCFLLPGGSTRRRGASGSSQSDVDAAKAKKDTATLATICSHRRTSFAVREAACHAAIDIYKERRDSAYLQKICNGSGEFRKWRLTRPACKARAALDDQNWMAEVGNCAKMKTFWKRYNGRILLGRRNRKGSHERMTKVIKAYLKCGMWDKIWVKLVHLGAHSGASGFWVLGKLTELGINVVAELWKYLNANLAAPFKFLYGQHAVGNIVHWLVKTGKTGNCARYLPIAKASSSWAQGEWIWFFSKSKCVQTQAWLLTQLAHRSAGRRSQVCFVLGRIGTKAAIRKLSIIARTDPAYRIKRLNRIYYVRDACRQAIGRIKLRN